MDISINTFNNILCKKGARLLSTMDVETAVDIIYENDLSLNDFLLHYKDHIEYL